MTKKSSYTLDSDLVSELLEALSNNWFSSCGEYNNTDIIEVDEKLRLEIEKQNKQNGGE